jgi:hypothetical protein
MQRVQANFHHDQRGMSAQLEAVRALVEMLDPELYAHLEAIECTDCLFCFRWLLLLFKRELEWKQTLRLWDALWSSHPTPHFHVFVCVALLQVHLNPC